MSFFPVKRVASFKSHTAILAAMVCLGAFSLCAQVLFTREMLVVFHGNELSIAVILGIWLLCVSVGAFASRLLAHVPFRIKVVLRLLALVFLFLAVMLPFQVLIIRVARLALHVPPGEYASLSHIVVCALVALSPTCLAVGLFFPLACRTLVAMSRFARVELERNAETIRCEDTRSISRVYTGEAMGSMAGGVCLTFLLLPFFSPLRLVMCASAIALTGALLIVGEKWGRRVFGVLAISIVAGMLVWPGVLRTTEERFVRARWQGLGLLGAAAGDPAATQLVCSRDSVYQNLTVLQREEQFTLFANGQVMFSYPDLVDEEHDVHFIMAQNPGARRILLLGGNPAGVIPQLLKYPIEQVVYVELDPAVGDVLGETVPDAYRAVVEDPRVDVVHEDGPRYMRACTNRFDAVIMNAMEPSTAGANRYYTLGFLHDVNRVVGEEGFVALSLATSARLQDQTAALAASVYKTLQAVFPTVLVTAGEQRRMLAGHHVWDAGTQDAAGPGMAPGITLDRQELARRSAAADVPTTFFSPDYFLVADELAPEKCEGVRQRLTGMQVPANTQLRPVTYFFNLLVWTSYSGSHLGGMLRGVAGLPYREIALGALLVGFVLLLVGVKRGRRAGAVAGRWPQVMVALVLASTGFSAMAIETLLILLFQALYGYVYTRLGLIVAVFMLGLCVGAPSGRLLAGGSARRAIGFMSLTEVMVILFALALPHLAGFAGASGMAGASPVAMEWVIYGCVAFAGWLVGAQFPLANRVFLEAGGNAGGASAITDASDHLGAAAGALSVGVILVPVLGLTASCVLLACFKVASLLCLGSATWAIPQAAPRPRE